jgi:hypothetical protein
MDSSSFEKLAGEASGKKQCFILAATITILGLVILRYHRRTLNKKK